jgi:hypothetical protein
LGAERRQRVLALDALLVEVVHALSAEGDGAVLLWAHDHEADAGSCVVARHLGQPGAEISKRLILAAGVRFERVDVARRAHDILERDAPALGEGRALGLTVIGQHDELVRARGVGDRHLHPCDLAVDLAQDGQRVVALDPRMVSHLVVGQEGRVDHGPPGHHVAHDGGDLQVALHDRRPCAYQRVRAWARDPRLDVVADLTRCARRSRT